MLTITITTTTTICRNQKKSSELVNDYRLQITYVTLYLKGGWRFLSPVVFISLDLSAKCISHCIDISVYWLVLPENTNTIICIQDPLMISAPIFFSFPSGCTKAQHRCDETSSCMTVARQCNHTIPYHTIPCHSIRPVTHFQERIQVQDFACGFLGMYYVRVKLIVSIRFFAAQHNTAKYN